MAAGGHPPGARTVHRRRARSLRPPRGSSPSVRRRAGPRLRPRMLARQMGLRTGSATLAPGSGAGCSASSDRLARLRRQWLRVQGDEVDRWAAALRRTRLGVQRHKVDGHRRRQWLRVECDQVDANGRREWLRVEGHEVDRRVGRQCCGLRATRLIRTLGGSGCGLRVTRSKSSSDTRADGSPVVTAVPPPCMRKVLQGRGSHAPPGMWCSRRGGPSPSELLEAWQLATWYLELTILRLIDYRGPYASRLVLGKRENETEPVPWASGGGDGEAH